MKFRFEYKRRDLIILIILMMILIMFFSIDTFGKEQHSTDVETRLRVAEPILTVENNPTIDVNGRNQKEYYSFIVKNQNEIGEINQVDLEYDIEIISNNQEKLSYKLYKDNQEIELNNNKTGKIKLKKRELQEDNYKLEILYDKDKPSNVTEIIQNVQIKVHSEQARR